MAVAVSFGHVEVSRPSSPGKADGQLTISLEVNGIAHADEVAAGAQVIRGARSGYGVALAVLLILDGIDRANRAAKEAHHDA